MRLPMKPSQTPASTPTLRSFFASPKPVARTFGAVRAPLTISSSFMMWAGLKKCRPSTNSGRDVAAAISSMSR